MTSGRRGVLTALAGGALFVLIATCCNGQVYITAIGPRDWNWRVLAARLVFAVPTVVLIALIVRALFKKRPPK